MQQLTIQATMTTTTTRVMAVLNTIRVMIVILMAMILTIFWDLIIGRGSWQKNNEFGGVFDIFVRLRTSFFLGGGGVMLRF